MKRIELNGKILEMVECAFDCDAPHPMPFTIVVNFKFQHCLLFHSTITCDYIFDTMMVAAGPILAMEIGIPSAAEETGRCEVKSIGEEDGSAQNCLFSMFFTH